MFHEITEEKLFFARAGLQHKLIKNLKQGKLKISEELDIHGMTLNQAEKTVSAFIDHAIRYQYRCIRIIHGKGKAVLKNFLDDYLKTLQGVLAFSSAQPRDGGSGALYVLLKKRDLA
jgi:DNA-nicking Smr family endonuclease